LLCVTAEIPEILFPIYDLHEGSFKPPPPVSRNPLCSSEMRASLSAGRLQFQSSTAFRLLISFACHFPSRFAFPSVLWAQPPLGFPAFRHKNSQRPIRARPFPLLIFFPLTGSFFDVLLRLFPPTPSSPPLSFLFSTLFATHEPFQRVAPPRVVFPAPPPRPTPPRRTRQGAPWFRNLMCLPFLSPPSFPCSCAPGPPLEALRLGKPITLLFSYHLLAVLVALPPPRLHHPLPT